MTLGSNTRILLMDVLPEYPLPKETTEERFIREEKLGRECQAVIVDLMVPLMRLGAAVFGDYRPDDLELVGSGSGSSSSSFQTLTNRGFARLLLNQLLSKVLCDQSKVANVILVFDRTSPYKDHLRTKEPTQEHRRQLDLNAKRGMGAAETLICEWDENGSCETILGMNPFYQNPGNRFADGKNPFRDPHSRKHLFIFLALEWLKDSRLMDLRVCLDGVPCWFDLKNYKDGPMLMYQVPDIQNPSSAKVDLSQSEYRIRDGDRYLFPPEIFRHPATEGDIRVFFWATHVFAKRDDIKGNIMIQSDDGDTLMFYLLVREKLKRIFEKSNIYKRLVWCRHETIKISSESEPGNDNDKQKQKSIRRLSYVDLNRIAESLLRSNDPSMKYIRDHPIDKEFFFEWITLFSVFESHDYVRKIYGSSCGKVIKGYLKYRSLYPKETFWIQTKNTNADELQAKGITPPLIIYEESWSRFIQCCSFPSARVFPLKRKRRGKQQQKSSSEECNNNDSDNDDDPTVEEILMNDRTRQLQGVRKQVQWFLNYFYNAFLVQMPNHENYTGYERDPNTGESLHGFVIQPETNLLQFE